MSERLLPFDEGCERGLLGALLIPEFTERVLPIVVRELGAEGEGFWMPAHRTVYRAMVAMHEGRKAIDLATVAGFLHQRGELGSIGGSVALDGLVDGTPTGTHAEYYLEVVRRKWRLRCVIEAARATEAEALGADEEMGVLGRAQERLAAIARGGKVEVLSNEAVMGGSIERWRDARAWKIEGDASKRPAIGLPLPWDELTEMICGLETGPTIVAGRPSAGKTTFEGQVRRYLGEGGYGTLTVTQDGTRRKLLERDLCATAEVSLPKMKFGFGRLDQLAKLEEARGKLGGYRWWFNESDADVAQIGAHVRQLRRTEGIDLVSVDHLAQITASELGRDGRDAYVRTTFVSGRLKALANELDMPLLVLCQLNRAVERENRRPQLSDLRDSGAIEQDARCVIFLWIDQKKRKELEEKHPGYTKHKRPVWCSVLKYQEGETGDIAMWLLPPYFRFEVARGTGDDPFGDDELPATYQEDKRLMGRHPAVEEELDGGGVEADEEG